MKKRLGLAIATIGTALTLLAPATAMARDRDDWGGNRGNQWREHERHERHEAEERWEHRNRTYRGGYYGGYYSAPSYGYGYSYQQPYYNGYYNQAPQGYYDRNGCYHRY
jgi:hypothetical protein